ncbi:EAL domain-containing protein [Anoxybacillus sp. LAT_35]|uniref:EAL and HDOD domain-containing protein n=1 Tax=Anoxybacillus TaxID=150247 RepID=UPI001EDA2694|nr:MULTISPECIES: EAL domain-containing protein [Anoxybacillus]MCG5025449.1 EAL domain-containing protein [Anoxybacillus flavithermus]MCG6197030.1 EAL domain-containing protein [Anoxybacillus sp. LAT_38]MCG3083254.1 EAL domain-containing protein [Anoxybacillus sp. LAT27]MCG3083724.1 EAL domain-containing protein [Anoxybacillus sp. LAT27]MCG6171322.1 EAL domain-containing protein [Anoxybacillus sp. LAT_11]
MDIYVGRQPILNRNDKVIGYELFYRSGEQNFYNAIDGDRATIDVLINSFMNIGIERLTNGGRCFINFTETLLKRGVPFHFPKHLIVVEILESIPYSSHLLHICKQLKERGYVIALDDFIFSEQYIPLLPYVDIIKIDFSKQTNYRDFKPYIEKYRIQLLAEKIETKEQLQHSKNEGFSYFQGYFFSKPIVVKEKSLPKIPYISKLNLIKQMNQNGLNFDEIVQTIENDPTLTYRLLKTVNSFFLSKTSKIKSIRHAAILLGTNHLKSWSTVLTLQEPNEPFKNEIIVNSLIRAKTLEQLAYLIHLSDEKDILFFMGICSSLHLLLQRPLQEILQELHIDEAIQQGLNGQPCTYSTLYHLVIALETNDISKLKEITTTLNIDLSKAFAAYQRSIEWVVELQNNIQIK